MNLQQLIKGYLGIGKCSHVWTNHHPFGQTDYSCENPRYKKQRYCYEHYLEKKIEDLGSKHSKCFYALKANKEWLGNYMATTQTPVPSTINE